MNRFGLTNLAVKITALLIGAVSLAACTGQRTIVTKDDSAVYHDAQYLPPLKKKTNPPTSDALESSVQLENETLPVGDTATAIDEDGIIGNDPSELAQEPAVPEQNKSLKVDSIPARIVEKSNNRVLLQIDAGDDEAWEWLRASVLSTELTLHSRNREAGLIYINCLDEQDLEKIRNSKKKRRWSLFRRNTQYLDYCALQLKGGKKSTSVTMINRDRKQASAESSRQVFSKLANDL